jgi:hypothetical protein
MPVRIEKPRIYSTKDMFLFWAKNMQKEKPHLILKHEKGLIQSNRNAELWYIVKEELNYLSVRNLQIDAEIQKLEKTDKQIDYFTNSTFRIFELKKEIFDNTAKIKELQKLPGDTKKLILDYEKFKSVVSSYNKLASESIIQGANLNLMNRLGYVQIRRIIPSTLKKKNVIDWKESYLYKKELIEKGETPKDKEHPEGKNWLVYKLQPWYLRWSWVKANQKATVKNNKVYAFYPTTGDTTTEINGVPGNKSKLSQAVRSNPLLHEKYTVVDLKEVRKNQRERYKQNKMLRLQKESTVNVPNETVN